MAVALLVAAGVFNLAFTSMAQTIVQTVAPPAVRGSVVGLFNTAMLGLRAGSGITVGVLGALLDVHLSLALSAASVVAVSALLLARNSHPGQRAHQGVRPRATARNRGPTLAQPRNTGVRHSRNAGSGVGRQADLGAHRAPLRHLRA